MILKKQLLLFGMRYDLFEEGKLKKLFRIGSQAMTGSCIETWYEDVKEGIRNRSTGNLATQRKIFTEKIQKFNEIYLRYDITDTQKTGMEVGKSSTLAITPNEQSKSSAPSKTHTPSLQRAQENSSIETWQRKSSQEITVGKQGSKV